MCLAIFLTSRIVSTIAIAGKEEGEVDLDTSSTRKRWTNKYIRSHTSQEALISQPSPLEESVECENPKENCPASPTNPQSGMIRTATDDIHMDHVATEGE